MEGSRAGSLAWLQALTEEDLDDVCSSSWTHPAGMLPARRRPDIVLYEAVAATRSVRVAEPPPPAAVAGLEALAHRHLGRVGEAPHLAQPPMEQLRERLGALDRERLDDVRVEETALGLPALGDVAHARTAADGEERRVVGETGAARRHEVGQAEPFARRLAGEGERLDHATVRAVEEDRLALGLRREELVDGPRFHRSRGEELVLDRGDALAEAPRLLVAGREQRLEVAAQPEVLAVEHGRIEIGEDLLEREAVEDVALQIGRGGNGLVMADEGRHRRRGPLRGGRRRLAQAGLRGLHL